MVATMNKYLGDILACVIVAVVFMANGKLDASCGLGRLSYFNWFLGGCLSSMLLSIFVVRDFLFFGVFRFLISLGICFLGAYFTWRFRPKNSGH